MRIIRKYEDAKKMVEDAGLIGENDGHPDIHYQEIAHLLGEVKRLCERLDLAERYIIEPTLIRNYFADVVSKGLDDERDNLG